MMTLKAVKQACLATVLGAVSASAEPALPSREGLPAIAAELRDLALARPREVHDAVLGGLRDCLPEETQVSLSSPAVIDLIVNSQLFYFALATQAMEEPDRRQKLGLAIDNGSRGLSDDERKDIEMLRRHGLEQGLTLLCVAATARGLLTSKPPTAAP